MKLAITAILAVLLFGFNTRWAASEDDRAGSVSWDRESAARYLDERMQARDACERRYTRGSETL